MHAAYARFISTFVLSFGLLLLLTGLVFGEGTAKGEGSSNAIITSVYRSTDKATKGVEIGDTITIEIEQLESWINANVTDPKDPKQQQNRRDPQKLILFLDGYPMNLSPVAVERERDVDGKLKFRLESTPDNRKAWIALLTKGKAQGTTVSVGLQGDLPFPVKAGAQPLYIIPCNPTLWWLCMLAFLALLALFIWLARQYPLLRDADVAAAGLARPYSLGRCQMALWFFTVLGSYISLRVILKTEDVLSNPVLALIGISAGTAISGAIVDSSKRDATDKQLQELKAQQKTRNDRLNEIRTELNQVDTSIAAARNAGAQPAPADIQKHEALLKEQQELIDKNNQAAPTIASLTQAVTGPNHVNFFTDILQDADGISFHRFQIFAWTIVLWLIFVLTVWHSLVMPAFSDQLLGLLGISSGTYIGFKFPERKV